MVRDWSEDRLSTTLKVPLDDLPASLREMLETARTSTLFSSSLPVLDITLQGARITQMTVEYGSGERPTIEFEVDYSGHEFVATEL